MSLPYIEKVENIHLSLPLKIIVHPTGQAAPDTQSLTKLEIAKRYSISIEGITRLILIVS